MADPVPRHHGPGEVKPPRIASGASGNGTGGIAHPPPLRPPEGQVGQEEPPLCHVGPAPDETMRYNGQRFQGDNQEPIKSKPTPPRNSPWWGFPIPDRSPPGAIIPTMKQPHTMVIRLDLTDRHRPHEDDIYPLKLKPGTLVVTDPNGEEHLFDGYAIINQDRSLTVIERGEVVAYFPEGCFHISNVG